MSTLYGHSVPEPEEVQAELAKGKRKWALIVIAAIIVVAAALFFWPSSASAQTTGGSKPSTFVNKAACEAALTSGNFTVYKPQYFGLKRLNPIDNVNLFEAKNEGTTCDLTQVVGGYKYVVSDETIKFRANKLADGTMIKRYREDCGNIVIPEPQDLVVPTSTAVAAAVQVAPAPTQMARAQGVEPCVDAIAVITQAQAKGARKGNYNVNCTPDGAVTVTVEQHKPGRSAWSRFWNPAGGSVGPYVGGNTGYYGGSGGGGYITTGSGVYGNYGPGLSSNTGRNYVYQGPAVPASTVPAGASLSGSTGTNGTFRSGGQ